MKDIPGCSNNSQNPRVQSNILPVIQTTTKWIWNAVVKWSNEIHIKTGSYWATSKGTPNNHLTHSKGNIGRWKIFFRNIDIKDGFWRMLCQAVAEWNFSYVLPGKENEDKILVVPISVHMGRTLYPAYFCTDTET